MRQIKYFEYLYYDYFIIIPIHSTEVNKFEKKSTYYIYSLYNTVLYRKRLGNIRNCPIVKASIRYNNLVTILPNFELFG